jgi:hypothetical protein
MAMGADKENSRMQAVNADRMHYRRLSGRREIGLGRSRWQVHP